MTQKRADKNPNPQGKGLVPLLSDLRPLSAGEQVQRSPLEVFRDYCLSSLVLAADFRFKPVPNKNYYLYSTAENWKLSLVAPQEWHAKMPGTYVAHAVMRADMTWQLKFTDLERGGEESQRLENFVAGFVENVWSQEDLRESLPVYAAQLPYHHRVLASGLAASLNYTMPRQELLTPLLQSSEGATALLQSARETSEGSLD